MNLYDFLDKGSILLDYELKSKKSVLELISETMAGITGTNADDIFAKLYEREKLGTTAFGNGIAIPHARIDKLINAKIMVLKLKTPVDFESVDNKKVDIIFTLLVPDDESDKHVEVLAKIASLLDNKVMRKKLRQAKNESNIISLLKDD